MASFPVVRGAGPGGRPPGPPAWRRRRFRYLAVGLVEVGVWFPAVGPAGRRGWFLAVGPVGRWLRIPDFWNLGGARRGGSSAWPSAGRVFM